MSASKSKKTRPPLPVTNANPLLKTVDREPLVKYQVIEREGQEIIIGRVKVPTPNNGHAFILRRFDTGAVSLTTMFRAAFPDASEEDEKTDTAWIKQAYDIAGANGGNRGNSRQYLRLAGTWLPVEVAISVAESYAIHTMIKPLVNAEPDLAQYFRKSAANTNGTQEVQEIKPPASAPAPPAKALSPPAPKRRKAASPAAAPPANAPLSPPSTTRKLRSSKSPAPTKPPSTSAKPRSSRRQATKAASPAAEHTEDEIEPEIASVDPDVDIEEAKQMVQEVKASYGKSGAKTSGIKRGVDEDTITFEPREPEIGERVIAGPRRVQNLPPQRQAAAWGALAFALGLGATAFLPQFFM